MTPDPRPTVVPIEGTPEPGRGIPRPVAQSRRDISTFWLVFVVYLAFGLVFCPIENWCDILVGYRLQNADILARPLREGNFFFYAIVMSAESVFVFFMFIALIGRSLGAIFLTLANMTLFSFSIIDYLVSYKAAFLQLGGELFRGPAIGQPFADQIMVSVLSLVFGYAIHHYVTSHKEVEGLLSLTKGVQPG